jgi:hypothetical protein
MSHKINKQDIIHYLKKNGKGRKSKKIVMDIEHASEEEAKFNLAVIENYRTENTNNKNSVFTQVIQSIKNQPYESQTFANTGALAGLSFSLLQLYAAGTYLYIHSDTIHDKTYSEIQYGILKQALFVISLSAKEVAFLTIKTTLSGYGAGSLIDSSVSFLKRRCSTMNNPLLSQLETLANEKILNFKKIRNL